MAEVKKAPKGEPTYMRLNWYPVKPGHMEQAVGMYREYALPVFEKLRENGAIFAAGLHTTEIASESDYALMSWTLIGQLGAMDTIDEAFSAANEARTEEERGHMMEQFMEHFEWEGYRSTIVRILHTRGKAETHDAHAGHDHDVHDHGDHAGHDHD
jgi:hypothetical protein